MRKLILQISPMNGGDGYIYKPSDLTLTHERIGTPSSLSGTIPSVAQHIPAMGDHVQLHCDGLLIFRGRLFSGALNRDNVYTFTAYDRLRYLKGNFLNYYKSCDVADVINDICIVYNLPTGKIISTGQLIPRQMIDSECAIDAIQRVIDIVTVRAQEEYILYDDYETGICFDNIEDYTLDNVNKQKAAGIVTGDLGVILSPQSLTTDYNYTVDIDTDTYNYIALHRPMSDTASRVTTDTLDAGKEQQWGRLIYTEEIQEQISAAQIHDRARQLLQIKCRPTRSLDITALGVPGLRAGMLQSIYFPELPDDISRRQRTLIDSITHTFSDCDHTMQISAHTFWRDDKS